MQGGSLFMSLGGNEVKIASHLARLLARGGCSVDIPTFLYEGPARLK